VNPGAARAAKGAKLKPLGSPRGARVVLDAGGRPVAVTAGRHPARSKRVAAVRELLGPDFKLMVDANQQWDRDTAMRVGRRMEAFNLTWIEEPLDAHDHEGHGQLAERFDTAAPLVAYEVRLAPDGRSLEWIERTAASETRYDTEPGTSWFQRWSIDVLSIFPVDWML